MNLDSKTLSAIFTSMNNLTGSSTRKDSRTEEEISRIYKQQFFSLEDSYTRSSRASLKTLLDLQYPEYEVEASFGFYHPENKFSPGIKSQFLFNKLEEGLKNMSINSKITKSVDRVESIFGSNLRKITENGHIRYERKNRNYKNAVHNEAFGVRITSSTERDITDDYTDQMFLRDWTKNVTNKKGVVENTNRKLATVRDRQRTSFRISIDGQSVSIDLTTVTETSITQLNEFSTIRYEVEIERKSNNVTVDVFIGLIKSVLDLLQNVRRGKLITDREKTTVISEHNKLFPLKRSKNELYISASYWNKPKNIKLHYMFEKEFDPWVTVKADGRRFSLFFDTNGVYLISPPWTIFKIGERVPNMTDTLLDCEYIEDNSTILVFDILFNRGVDLRMNKLKERYNECLKICKAHPKISDYNLKAKVYFTEGTVFEKTRAAFNSIQDGDKTDGLIFQPRHWYKNNHTYKWKPIDQLTIDFKLLPTRLTTEYIPGVLSGGNIIPFTGSTRYVYKGVIKYGPGHGGKIVECKWNGKEFSVYRERDDRTKPNYMDVAIDVWADIVNPISQKSIEGKTLQMMRKYHNNEKKELLSKYFSKGDTIVDIGSGRGGDVKKWNDIGLGKVYAIEPNDTNAKELFARKNGFSDTKVEILGFGAEETDIVKKIVGSNHINGIVSFFSLTFFPKSQELYSKLLDTISLIPEGGMFIGAVLDGRSISLAFDQDRRDNDLGSLDAAEIRPPFESFTIEQSSMFKTSPFGDKIEIDIPDTMVNNQTEWLFYFDYFRDQMEKRGFVLVEDRFLDNGSMFEKLPKESKLFSSFNRIFAFEHQVGKSINKDLDYGVRSKLHTTPKSTDIYYTGVIYDESNFIHAFLESVSPNYSSSSKSNKRKQVSKLREKIVSSMTFEDFIANSDSSIYLSKNKNYGDQAGEISYDEFLLDILGDKYLTSEFKPVLERIYGLTIYIVTGNPAMLPIIKCEKDYVLLYKLTNGYYSIGKGDSSRNKTIFKC